MGLLNNIQNSNWHNTVSVTYGKTYHSPVELEHKAFWAIEKLNFDLKTVGQRRSLQLNELDELQLHA